MDRKLLSIIIPVYKVKEYIRQCLNSILSQNSDDIEVIIIDDGCPDNSLCEAEDIICQNENTILITQSNKGLSSARNAGLEKATGSFVVFVDSDDYIIEDGLVKLVSAINSEPDIDVISYGYTKNSTSVNYKGMKEGETLRISLLEFMSKTQNLLVNVWRYAYKREFLLANDISFRKGVYCEDIEFLNKVFFNQPSVLILNSTIYHYRYMRKNSISQVVSVKRINDTSNNILYAHNLYDNLNSDYESILINHLCKQIIYNMSFYYAIANEKRNDLKLARMFDIFDKSNKTKYFFIKWLIKIFNIKLIYAALFIIRKTKRVFNDVFTFKHKKI